MSNEAESSTSGAEAVVELLLEQQQLEAGASLDITAVQTLLEAGANPNSCVREDDVSPMHIAAGLDNDAAYAYLQLLLKYEGWPRNDPLVVGVVSILSWMWICVVI